MKYHLLKGIAVAVGLCVSAAVHAQQPGYPGHGYANYPAYQQSYNPTQQAPGYPVHQPQRFAAPQSRVIPAQQQQAPASFSTQMQSRLAGTGAPMMAPAPGVVAAPGVPAPSVPAPMMHGNVVAPTTPIAAGPGCTSCNAGGSVYSQAMAQPWTGGEMIVDGGMVGGGGFAPAPTVLNPWFGQFDILFMQVENNEKFRPLLFDDAAPATVRVRTDDLFPGSDVGYNVGFGRYFGCGQYGIGINYFNFDPDAEFRSFTPAAAGDYRASFRNWDRLDTTYTYAGQPAASTVYDFFDRANSFRVMRDLDIQGIELNLFNFGIGGARRAPVGGGMTNALNGVFGARGMATCGTEACGTSACGPASCGPCGGSCGPTAGFGGICNPLIGACNSRLQFTTSHGLRWFNVRDRFQLAASATDNVFGNTNEDLYYNVDTDNNLIGYQFGGRMTYCLGNSLNVSVGSKCGIYNNEVTFRQQFVHGDGANAVINAAYPTYQGQNLNTRATDNVLAALGEIDLGIGYRINCAVSVRGGYRLLGASGIALSTSHISDDPARLPYSTAVAASDNLIMHGGYFGIDYNW